MMEPLKAIIGLSLKLLLRSRKTLVMAVLALAPSVLAFLGVIIARVNPDSVGITGFGLASELFVPAYLHFFVIGLPLFYATSFIREEVDEKTITYIFVRPIPKATIYAGKYIAGTLASMVLVIPSAALMLGVLSTLDPLSEVLRHSGVFLQDLAILGLGIMAYCALFGAFGALLKRPLLWGGLFAIVWEVFVTYIPGYIHNFTILHHLLSLLPHPSSQRGSLKLFEAITSLSQSTPPAISVITIFAISGALLALSCWVVSRKEYLLEA